MIQEDLIPQKLRLASLTAKLEKGFQKALLAYQAAPDDSSFAVLCTALQALELTCQHDWEKLALWGRLFEQVSWSLTQGLTLLEHMAGLAKNLPKTACFIDQMRAQDACIPVIGWHQLQMKILGQSGKKAAKDPDLSDPDPDTELFRLAAAWKELEEPLHFRVGWVGALERDKSLRKVLLRIAQEPGTLQSKGRKDVVGKLKRQYPYAYPPTFKLYLLSHYPAVSAKELYQVLCGTHAFNVDHVVLVEWLLTGPDSSVFDAMRAHFKEKTLKLKSLNPDVPAYCLYLQVSGQPCQPRRYATQWNSLDALLKLVRLVVDGKSKEAQKLLAGFEKDCLSTQGGQGSGPAPGFMQLLLDLLRMASRQSEWSKDSIQILDGLYRTLVVRSL